MADIKDLRYAVPCQKDLRIIKKERGKTETIKSKKAGERRYSPAVLAMP